MMNLSSLSKANISIILCFILGFAASFVDTTLSLCIYSAGIIIASCLIHTTQKSIKNATCILHKMKKGDFEARITNIGRNGEIEEFLWAVNEMTDSMDAFVRESTAAMEHVSHNQYFRRILEDGLDGDLLTGARIINIATENVAQKMDEFAGIAGDVDASLKSVISEVNTCVTQLESNTDTMQMVVSQAKEETQKAIHGSEETAASASSISAAAEEMSASIAEISSQITKTADIAGNAVSNAEQARGIVENLAETAQSINDVIALIEDIAEQTNLLALNATIEAARAGEAGKGFAVVASEVKTLAGQTAQATEQIRTQIGNVQGATNNAVTAFDTIGKTVSEISEACNVVAAAVEEQNAASREIASNAEMASNYTRSTSQNVTSLGENVGDVDTASLSIKEVSANLSEHSQKHITALLQKMDVFMTELRKIT